MTNEAVTQTGRKAPYVGNALDLLPVSTFNRSFQHDNVIPFPEPSRHPKEHEVIMVHSVAVPFTGLKLLLMRELRYTSEEGPVSKKRLLEVLNYDGISDEQLERRFYNSFEELKRVLRFRKTGCLIIPTSYEFEPGIPETAYFLNSVFEQKKEVKGEARMEKPEAVNVPVEEILTDSGAVTERAGQSYVTFSHEDIDAIVSPPRPEHKLDAADMRILAALIRTDSEHILQVDDLARKTNPNKLTGLAREIASVPGRIDYCNAVVLRDTGMNIIFPSPLEPSSGYYLGGAFPLRGSAKGREEAVRNRSNTIARAVRRIEETQKVKPHHEYCIASKPLDGNRACAVSVAKDNEPTREIIFRDVIVEDVVVPPEVRLGETRKPGKIPTYALTASKQLALFSLLFQNEPVPMRIVRNYLADDRDPISQRELQLYVDLLNGKLSSGIASLKEQGKLLSDGIANFGIRIGIVSKKLDDQISEECLRLFDINIDPTEEKFLKDSMIDPEIDGTRQRKRQPSHGKIGL